MLKGGHWHIPTQSHRAEAGLSTLQDSAGDEGEFEGFFWTFAGGVQTLFFWTFAGGLQTFAGFEQLTHNSVLPLSSQAVHTSVGSTIIAEVLFHSTQEQQNSKCFPTSESKNMLWQICLFTLWTLLKSKTTRSSIRSTFQCTPMKEIRKPFWHLWIILCSCCHHLNNPIFTKCITFAPLLTLAPLLKRWLLHCRAPFTTTRRPATSFVREQTTSQTCSFRSQILLPFMEILGLQSTLYIYINNFSGQFIYSDLYNRCVQFCMIIAPYIVLFLCNVTKCKEKKISTQMIFLDSSTTRWSTSSQLKMSQFTLFPSQHGR